MIYHLRKPVKHAFYLIAWGIIVCALVLQLGRLAIPWISSYRADLEAFSGRQLQAKVSFGVLSGSWYGLRPQIMLQDVSVVSRENEPIFSVKSARMQLDIFSSLVSRVPVWHNLEFQDLEITVQQNAQGGWSVGGLSPGKGQQSGWYYQNPGALFLMTGQVDIDAANINLVFHNQRRLTSSIPKISIQNDGHFHRLNARVGIDDQTVMNLVMEGEGNPGNPDQFAAKAYLELQQFPLERVVNLFSQVTQRGFGEPALTADKSPKDTSAEAVQDAGVDLKLWFDFASPSQFSMNGHLDLVVKNPSEFARANYLHIPVTADISGNYSIDNGLTIGLNNPVVDRSIAMAPLELNLHQDRLTLTTGTMELEPLSQWFSGRVISSGKFRTVIAALAPRGRLDNVRLQIDLLDLEQTMLQTNITNGSISPWKSVPGFQQVNGYIESRVMSGFALLKTKDFQIHPQRIYRRALGADLAKGYIGWQLSPPDNRVSIYGRQLMAEGDFGQAAGNFHLLIPWKPGSYPAELALQIGVSNSHSDYYESFLPDNFPEGLRQWMKESMQSAVINEAGFIYRGTFKAGNNRTMQFYANFDEGALKMEGWPLLADVTSSLVVNNKRMYALIDKAAFYPGDNLSGRVDWNRQGQKWLGISVAGDTEFSSGLGFIRNSWLGSKTGGVFDDWSGHGRIDVRADISIPIASEAGDDAERATGVRVDLDFNNNNFTIKKPDLDFSGITGEISYSSETGFGSRDLGATLFDRAFTAELGSIDSGGNSLWMQGRGAIAVDALSDWVEQPLTGLMKGDLAYNYSLTVPLQKTEKQPASLTLGSDLDGVEFRLPAPFGGTSAPRTFVMNLAFEPESSHYRFRLDDNLLGDIYVDNSGSPKGSIFVSDREVALDSNDTVSGIEVRGNFTSLPLDQWLEVLEGISATQSTDKNRLPLSFRIEADQVIYGHTKLKEVTFSGQREDQGWMTAIMGPILKGDVFVPDSKAPVVVNLDYLRFDPDPTKSPDDKPGQDSMADIQLSEVRAADITIQDLRHGDKALGRWSFSVVPDERGIELRNIRASLNGLAVGGKDKDQGAHLRWEFPGDSGSPMHTRFTGNLGGGNIRSLFDVFKLPPVLQSKSTDINMEFDWVGSPANISVENLSGSTKFYFNKGVFTQEKADSATDILKLFGLINFDTWARRIRLDFSDLYKKGLTYDKLFGSVDIDNGLITTREAVSFQGPSSDFSLSGSVNYPKQQINAELVATLPVSGNLTVATALAAGLPAAAGVYVVSKLLKKQVDQASSITYDIAGSLDVPVVTVRSVLDEDSDGKDESKAASCSSDPENEVGSN